MAEAKFTIRQEDLDKLIAGLKKSEMSVEEFEQAVQDLNKLKVELKGVDKAKADLDSANASAEALKNEGALLKAAWDKAAAAFQAAAKKANFDPSSASAKRLRKDVEKAGAAIVKFGTRGERALDGTEKELDDVRRAARKARTELDKFKGSAKNINSLGKSLRSLRTILIGLGFATAVRALSRFIESAVEAKRIFDGLEFSLRAATKTTEEYERANATVIETSRRLGLEIGTLGRNYSNLIASTGDLNISQREVEDLFIATAEAARVFQIPAKQTERAFNAIAQSASKGVLSMEEVRQQLSEAIPGVVPKIAKALDLTNAEFIKLVSTGKILAEDALPAITAAMRELAGDQVVAAAASLNAQIGRVGNAFLQLKARVVEANEEVGSEFLDSLEKVISESPVAEKALANLVKNFIDVSDELVQMAPAAVQVADLLGTTLAVAIKGLLAPLKLAGGFVKDFTQSLVAFYDILNGGEGEFEFEAIVIAAEETAQKIGLVNEKLLAQQGKNADEAIRIAQETEDQITRVVEEAGRDRVEAERMSAAEREKILTDLAKKLIKIDIAASLETLDAFDAISDQSKIVAEHRIADSAAMAEQISQLETALGEDIGVALDRQLDKTKLTNEQRVELQRELSEELLRIEAEAFDKLEAARAKFAEEIEGGGDRKEAEEKLQETLVALEEAALEKRLDLLGKYVENAGKLEEKRIKDLEKVLEELEKAEQESLDALPRSASRRADPRPDRQSGRGRPGHRGSEGRRRRADQRPAEGAEPASTWYRGRR